MTVSSITETAPDATLAGGWVTEAGSRTAWRVFADVPEGAHVVSLAQTTRGAFVLCHWVQPQHDADPAGRLRTIAVRI